MGLQPLDKKATIRYTQVYTNRMITFAYDKVAQKPHYQVRHGDDIEAHEFEELFAGPVVVIGQQGLVLKAVGRTAMGRFVTVIFIRRQKEDYHVITAWPSKRKQILLWHQEVMK